MNKARQGVRNFNDGISFLNVAERATSQLTNMLIRIRELATQTSNGTIQNTQRQALDKEVQALQTEYNRYPGELRTYTASFLGSR